MNMPIIVQMPFARINLAELLDYTAEDSKEMANTFIDKINSKIHLLNAQPDFERLQDDD